MNYCAVRLSLRSGSVYAGLKCHSQGGIGGVLEVVLVPWANLWEETIINLLSQITWCLFWNHWNEYKVHIDLVTSNLQPDWCMSA